MSMLMLRINDDGLKSNLRVVRVVFPTLKMVFGGVRVVRVVAVCFPDLKKTLRVVRVVFPTLKIKLSMVYKKVYTIFNNRIAKSIYLRYVKVLPAVLPAKSVYQNLSNALFFSIFRYSCG